MARRLDSGGLHPAGFVVWIGVANSEYLVSSDMSMLAALARKWHYSVGNPGAGRLVYREGNREYTFPLYEEDGELVLAAVPSSQRIYFFFSWCCHPHEFSVEAQQRILPRIEAHLRQAGERVRIFERGGQDGDFEFYPELFDHRARAGELLAAAGYDWFSDYSSIDVLHGEYGLEVCGIQHERDAKEIAEILGQAFPHWHHQNLFLNEQGREPGWAVALGMFPARTENAGWHDGD